MAALYRALAVFRPARSAVQLESDRLVIATPDGRTRRLDLHGCTVHAVDGFVVQRVGIVVRAPRMGERQREFEPPRLRRFVRMLVLERDGVHHVLITPPEEGAVAPDVISVAEAPADAPIVDGPVWDALADWLLGGGRLSAFSIADLARIAAIATATFAALIGEVAARRALEMVAGHGPMRGGLELEAALEPLIDAARHSPHANEALVAALAHAALPGLADK